MEIGLGGLQVFIHTHTLQEMRICHQVNMEKSSEFETLQRGTCQKR